MCTPRPLPGPAVLINGLPVALDSLRGQAIVRDSARYTEGLITETEFRRVWGLTDLDWAAMATNLALTEVVRQERQRRIDCGEAAAETARKAYAKAPYVLSALMESNVISPRHRIEAVRELRAITGFSRDSGAALDGEKVVITINLGNDAPTVFSGPLGPFIEESEHADAEQVTRSRGPLSNPFLSASTEGEGDDYDDR